MKISGLLAAIIVLLTGCISTAYRGETFPATTALEVYRFNEKLPDNCRVIGSGTASGEFSGTSNADLIEKLKELGMRHGARYMRITGTRIVPTGTVADDAGADFRAATDDPDQLAFDNTVNEELDPPRPRQTYKRIMYAEFLR